MPTNRTKRTRGFRKSAFLPQWKIDYLLFGIRPSCPPVDPEQASLEAFRYRMHRREIILPDWEVHKKKLLKMFHRLHPGEKPFAERLFASAEIPEKDED